MRVNGFTRGARVCVALAALALAAAAPLPEEAPATDVVWRVVGPVPGTAGFTAVARDPVDSRVVWIGGGSSVWVSDDGGEHFALLVQLSRLAGAVRENGDGTTDDSTEDPEDADPADPEDGEVDENGDPVDPLDPTTSTTTGDAPADPGEETSEPLEDSGDSNNRFGIARIRVLKDWVYVCTGRGLWKVARSARRAGGSQEIRFGRRVAVNDVAEDAAGRLFVATESGLVTIGSDGIGRSVTGFTDEVDILAMTMLGDRLVVAAADGLRIQSDVGFQRLGTLGARESISDIVAISATRLGIVAGDQVLVMSVEPGRAAIVEDAQSAPGATRLALGRAGTMWVVGPKGAWQYRTEEGWRPHNEGLLDRRLADVAPSAQGDSQVYAVGRGGALRLVPDLGRVWSDQARSLATKALEGLPSAAETLQWADEARPVHVGDGSDLAVKQGLSWFLPLVTLTIRASQARYEDRLLIPALNERILDAVRVLPTDEIFRIEFRWNLMPALEAAFSGTDPQIHDTENRARVAQVKVRQAVGPLYETWVTKRIELAATQHGDALTLAKELLALEQMEADLHVYTNGRFPVGTAGDAPNSSTP